MGRFANIFCVFKKLEKWEILVRFFLIWTKKYIIWTKNRNLVRKFWGAKIHWARGSPKASYFARF